MPLLYGNSSQRTGSVSNKLQNSLVAGSGPELDHARRREVSCMAKKVPDRRLPRSIASLHSVARINKSESKNAKSKTSILLLRNSMLSAWTKLIPDPGQFQ